MHLVTLNMFGDLIRGVEADIRLNQGFFPRVNCLLEWRWPSDFSFCFLGDCVENMEKKPRKRTNSKLLVVLVFKSHFSITVFFKRLQADSYHTRLSLRQTEEQQPLRRGDGL